MSTDRWTSTSTAPPTGRPIPPGDAWRDRCADKSKHRATNQPLANRKEATMRTPKILAVVATAAAAGVAGLATTAHAAEAGLITRPTTSYSSPSQATMPVHSLRPGDQVETLCFTEGQSVNGNAYWFRISRNGDSGYVHRDAMIPPTELRHC
jgi:hypothetical protein